MLNALSPNLAPSLDLMSGRGQGRGVPARRHRPHPRADADRDRAAAEGPDSASPTACCRTVLYGANHPYGGPPAAIRRRSPSSRRDDLVAFRAALAAARQCQDLHRLRPAAEPRSSRCSRRVSDNGRRRRCRRASRISPALPPRPDCAEDPADQPAGRAAVDASSAAQLLPIDPQGDIVPFDTANDVLGGTFLSRLNMDLRETKGWSYGVSGDESRARACGALCGLGAGAGGPHRRFAGRAQQADRASS